MWICVFICFLLLCSLSSLQPALDSSETCKYMLMVIWKSSAKKKLWVALLFGKRRAKD